MKGYSFENIAISLRNHAHENPDFKVLMDRCCQYGRVIVARAYADWGNHHSIVYALHASGFDPVYVPTYSYGSNGQHPPKNAVDIRMAIQAMEVLYTCRHVNTFILMTGDKDFVPLALSLRRQGKKVVAFAVENTASNYLQDAVDEIVFYGQILEQAPPKSEPAAPTKPKRQPDKPAALQAAFSLLQQTVAQALAGVLLPGYSRPNRPALPAGPRNTTVKAAQPAPLGTPGGGNWVGVAARGCGDTAGVL